MLELINRTIDSSVFDPTSIVITVNPRLAMISYTALYSKFIMKSHAQRKLQGYLRTNTTAAPMTEISAVKNNITN